MRILWLNAALAGALAGALAACQPPAAAPSTAPLTIGAVSPLRVELVGSGSARAARAWSCAAYCIESYHCNADGDSTSTGDLVLGSGASAADAFEAISKQCKGAHADLDVHGDCVQGVWHAEGASISTSCAAD